MTMELADNVRKYRCRAGMSQEELAHAAGLSPATVRKVEQGGTVRMETLHALARALGIPTAALVASDALEPVGRAEEPNRLNLIQLRAALTPAVWLVDQDAQAVGEEPNLRAYARTVRDEATDSGIPARSVSTWIFAPVLPRSTRLSPAMGSLCPHRCSVQDRP